MTAVQMQIAANLQDLGEDNFSSFLTGTVDTLQRNVVLDFPAACWEQARAAGLSFTDVLESLKDSAYDFLDFLCISFPGFDGDSDVFVSNIVFSSLFRPGADPHSKGRAFDIVQIKVSTGDKIIFNNINGNNPENSFAKFLREVCFPVTGALQVSQYFTPWKMCTIDSSGARSVKDNDRTHTLDVEHLTHLHVTIFR